MSDCVNGEEVEGDTIEGNSISPTADLEELVNGLSFFISSLNNRKDYPDQSVLAEKMYRLVQDIHRGACEFQTDPHLEYVEAKVISSFRQAINALKIISQKGRYGEYIRTYISCIEDYIAHLEGDLSFIKNLPKSSTP